MRSHPSCSGSTLQRSSTALCRVGSRIDSTDACSRMRAMTLLQRFPPARASPLGAWSHAAVTSTSAAFPLLQNVTYQNRSILALPSACSTSGRHALAPTALLRPTSQPAAARAPSQGRRHHASDSAACTATAKHMAPAPPGQTLATSTVTAYLSTLNQEQQDAVYCTATAVRVKAGPGSGKTRVVTARVARLVHDGHWPETILVITFTNKAADELKERLEGVLGTVCKRLSAGTFHSICAGILRSYVERLPPLPVPAGEAPLEPWDRNFTILDTDESERAMRMAVMTVMKVDTSDRQIVTLAKRMYEMLSEIRSEVSTIYSPAFKFELSSKFTSIDGSPFKQADMIKCFKEYTRVCAENNAIDFDDLLGLTVMLLENVPAVRQKLQQQWKHVLVDEFQDTNAAQYRLVHLLRGPEDSGCTTFVVGDSDQAIYSWRGANPDNMDVQFGRQFPDGTTHFLSSNYRSGSHIVEAAEAVLGCNGMPQMHRRTKPMKPSGGSVCKVDAFNDRDEARVVKDIILQRHKAGVNYEEIAVLYRTRFQSRLLQEQIAVAGIPFRVLGEKPFWTRSEIKTMAAYLRVTANPARDSMALEQIINVPVRKIGPKTIITLKDIAEHEGVSFATLVLGDLANTPPLPLDRLEELLGEVEREGEMYAVPEDLLPDVASAYAKQYKVRFTKGVIKGIQQLRTTVYLARSTAHHKTVADAVHVLELASGFLADLEGSDAKLESLAILRNAARSPDTWVVRKEELERREEGQLGGMDELQLFLQHVCLMREIDEQKDKDTDTNRVTLMTIHAAKGLEYHTVLFVGFEDGLVPLVRKADEMLPPLKRDKLFQEEKRLAYVGVTRAKEELMLVVAKGRTAFTSTGPVHRDTSESPFLKAIRNAAVPLRLV